MTPRIVRPDISPDRREELRRYLAEMWRRAETGRSGQIDVKYTAWGDIYSAKPEQARRTVPWPGASNLVVPLARIFIDTFCARTLGLIFATRPVYVMDGLPTDHREILEQYINRKAVAEWNHYTVASRMLNRGNRYGTVVCKTPWVEEMTVDVQGTDDGSDMEQRDVVRFAGPKAAAIPFEDFFVYPITADDLTEVEIKFHRLRFSEERARRKVQEGIWSIPSQIDSMDDRQWTEVRVESALRAPADVKKTQDQTQAAVDDSLYRELTLVECHLEYPISAAPDRYYSVIVLLQPDTQDLYDIYFNPWPLNLDIFHEYKPFPRDGLWWGESLAGVLAPFQEEASTLHNERRNNATLASMPMVAKVGGGLQPNQSDTWFPGKIWQVEQQGDISAIEIGRNYLDTMPQEMFTIQLAERLTGIGSAQQGYAAGMMGKRGIYNASGTLAILQESNERQNTAIRDFRQVLASIAKTSFHLQAAYGQDDKTIEYFSPEQQQKLREALTYATQDRIARCQFEVKASDAGQNRETERMALMQMNQVLGQYSQEVQQLANLLANQNLNPVLKEVYGDIVRMRRGIAKRLLRAFGEADPEGVLPNVEAALQRQATSDQQTQQAASGPRPPMEPGAGPGVGQPLTRDALRALVETGGPVV